MRVRPRNDGNATIVERRPTTAMTTIEPPDIYYWVNTIKNYIAEEGNPKS